jgi:hypothetical protein
MALVAYNVTVVIKAAIAAANSRKPSRSSTANEQGPQAPQRQREISTYYVADEIQATWTGMMIALPPEYCEQSFSRASSREIAQELIRLAKAVDVQQFAKSVRGPKRPPPKRTRYTNTPHVSTHRLLDAEKVRRR